MWRLLTSRHLAIELSECTHLVIGRGEQCDVQLDDPSASRVHCRIDVVNECLRVTDLQSRWGTYVNGQQVREHQLHTGDRLQIGETTFVAEDTARADQTQPPNDLQTGIRKQETMACGASAVDDGQSYVIDEGFAEPKHYSLPFTPQSFIGQQFATCQIDSMLAETTTSVIFRAKTRLSGRYVALRVFRPETFETSRDEDRFRRAAGTVLQLHHPNVVRLLDAGKTQGYCYTTSQLIEGESAVELLRRIGVVGMLDCENVLQIAVDLCEALRCIESHRILHRNIKPSNILIAERNGRKTAYLNDLVLAKALNASGQEKLTQPGEVPGDVGYMSPEQLGSGYAVDCRSDIYQLGVTLYALLTGQELFSDGTMAARIRAILTELPQPIQHVHMATPPQFDSLVLKMLKKNPNERFQNAEELSLALRKVAADLGQSDIRPTLRDPDDEGWRGALDGLV